MHTAQLFGKVMTGIPKRRLVIMKFGFIPNFALSSDSRRNCADKKVHCKISGYPGKHEQISSRFVRPALWANFAIAKFGFILAAILFLVLFFADRGKLIASARGGLAYGGESWVGVDEGVVEKVAAEYGRHAWKPFINTDQGDLLLFVFLLAGTAGGFLLGFCWRKLFVEKGDPKC